jgi:hypothetical protein
MGVCHERSQSKRLRATRPNNDFLLSNAATEIERRPSFIIKLNSLAAYA